MQQLEDKPFLSPYLCPWCRNGLSLNEAHENCLAGGKFDRFWPEPGIALGDVPAFPVRDLSMGKFSPHEVRVIIFFYLWLITTANPERPRASSLVGGKHRSDEET